MSAVLLGQGAWMRVRNHAGHTSLQLAGNPRVRSLFEGEIGSGQPTSPDDDNDNDDEKIESMAAKLKVAGVSAGKRGSQCTHTVSNTSSFTLERAPTFGNTTLNDGSGGMG
jgi:hypothetical protein